MSVLSAFIYAFGLSIGAIVVLRPLCVRLGHVDRPGGRKTHRLATPLSGGIAIVGCVVALAYLVMPSQRFAGFAFGALVLLGLGALDDHRPVSPILRLTLQTLAVGLGMCALGHIRLVDLGALCGPRDVTLGSFGPIVTVIAAVGVINAVNMIDGTDGIAGGFAVLVTCLILALGTGSTAVNTGLLCLTIGSLLAFLMFNMRTPWQRQARCFLGDAGSMVLGYILVWFVIAASQGDGGVFDPVTAVWLFGLPVADTNYLMGSRLARGKSPFVADRYHLPSSAAGGGFRAAARAPCMASGRGRVHGDRGRRPTPAHLADASANAFRAGVRALLCCARSRVARAAGPRTRRSARAVRRGIASSPSAATRRLAGSAIGLWPKPLYGRPRFAKPPIACARALKRDRPLGRGQNLLQPRARRV